jgi:hypothetical protein
MRTFKEFILAMEDSGLFGAFPQKPLTRKPATAPFLHDYSDDPANSGGGGGGGGAPVAPAAPKKMRKKMRS